MLNYMLYVRGNARFPFFFPFVADGDPLACQGLRGVEGHGAGGLGLPRCLALLQEI